MEGEALTPLASAPEASAFDFADRAVRQVFPLGLEASGMGAAARAVRTLPEVANAEAARRSMFALEKLARAHAAPELLVRAAHGVCACALSLGLAQPQGGEAAERGCRQLVSVLVRLVLAALKAGAPAEKVLATLAGCQGSADAAGRLL